MSSPDTAAAAATQKKDSEDANAPLVQILRLFRGWFLTRSETKAGRLEAVVMFCFIDLYPLRIDVLFYRFCINGEAGVQSFCAVLVWF